MRQTVLPGAGCSTACGASGSSRPNSLSLSLHLFTHHGWWNLGCVFCHKSPEFWLVKRARLQHEQSAAMCEIQRCTALSSWDLSGWFPVHQARGPDNRTFHVHHGARYTQLLTLTREVNSATSFVFQPRACR